MERRNLDPVLEKFLHDRVHLLAREHEVAHHHRLVAHRHEGEPGAEREAGFEIHAVQFHLEIAARQPDAIDAAPLNCSLLAERLRDGFPIRLGMGRNACKA